MMAATRDIQVYHDLPEQVRSSILALSILIDRIGTLPKADRDDLFELLQEWQKVDNDEDRRSIHRAMDEILAQIPVTASPLQAEPHRLPVREPWCNHIGKTVRELREAAGLNQTDLAKKAGLTQSHISRIENAEHHPTNFTLEKIAKALGVKVSQIDPCLDD
jgi:DNA-binding XRE family transcriptional regulator